jgi:hypothetical protein
MAKTTSKPADRILFTTSISYAWRSAILGGTGGEGPDVEIRVIEVPVPSSSLARKSGGPDFLSAIEVEMVSHRDRFGAPSWERSNLPPQLIYAVLWAAAPLAGLTGADAPSKNPHFVFGPGGLSYAVALVEGRPEAYAAPAPQGPEDFGGEDF